MADQDLRLNVTATATGDGLRKTAEEVKALNAATREAAGAADEQAVKEQRLTDLLNRRADAAREAAGAAGGGGGALGGAGPEGGGAGESLLGVGVAGGLAGAAATAATMLAKEAIDGLMNITTRMEEARLETEKLTAELMKQSAQFLALAEEVNSRKELLGIQRSMRTEIEQTREAIYALERSGGSWVDKMKEWAEETRGGTWVAELIADGIALISTKREEDIERLKEQRAAQEALFAAEERSAVKILKDFEAMEKLTPAEKIMALNDALMEMQVRQSGFAESSEGWNKWAVRIEEVEKRIRAANAEVERGNELREKEGQQLDANMRKEGEKFAKAEEARAKEEERAAKEKERLRAEGDAIEDAMERERQKNAREDARAAEKIDTANRRAFEQAEKETQRRKEREASDRLRYGIPEGGINPGGGAPARTGSLLGGGPGMGFSDLRPHAVAARPPDNTGLKEAAAEVAEVIHEQIKAAAILRAAAETAKADSYHRS